MSTGTLPRTGRLSAVAVKRPEPLFRPSAPTLCFGNRRVGRLMWENVVSVIRTLKLKVTFDSGHTFSIAPNPLKQDFATGGPNQERACDIAMSLHAKTRYRGLSNSHAQLFSLFALGYLFLADGIWARLPETQSAAMMVAPKPQDPAPSAPTGRRRTTQPKPLIRSSVECYSL